MTEIFHVSDELPHGLHLIDLPQPMEGFHHFISAWFFTDAAGRRIVVDPGPASTVPLLLKELAGLTDDIDFVLLTHIHLDHSGGAGQLCEMYANAKVVAHPKAGRHLVSPEKLWKSSLATLGTISEMYGEPMPLPWEKLAGWEELPGIEIFETPGHATHHISFIVPFSGAASVGASSGGGRSESQRLFFVGEAAGLRLPMGATPYFRPTTPPKFDVPAARESLTRMESVLQGDELLCYGHWGVTRDPRTQIAAVKKQIDEWLREVSGMADRPVREIAEYLISHDPCLAGYSSLPDDLRSRELIFMDNSIKGFLDYLKNCG